MRYTRSLYLSIVYGIQLAVVQSSIPYTLDLTQSHAADVVQSMLQTRSHPAAVRSSALVRTTHTMALHAGIGWACHAAQQRPPGRSTSVQNCATMQVRWKTGFTFYLSFTAAATAAAGKRWRQGALSVERASWHQACGLHLNLNKLLFIILF